MENLNCEWMGYWAKDGRIIRDEETEVDETYIKNVLIHNCVERQHLFEVLPDLYEEYHAAMDVTTYSPDTVDAFHQYLRDQCYARGLFNAVNFCVTKNVVTNVLMHRSGNLFPTGCKFVWNET